MKFLIDFLPILLFFISYKILGIYYATVIAIIVSFAQVLFYRLKYQSFDKFQVTSFAVILVLGGATLFFQNPWFIKWKPTGIYWLTSVVFLLTTYLGPKPLIQRMMEHTIGLPVRIWKRLNLAWAFFFTLMGFANLYVAYNYSTDIWVNFKLFGGVGLTLLFVIIQAIYLSRHIDENLIENSKQ